MFKRIFLSILVLFCVELNGTSIVPEISKLIDEALTSKKYQKTLEVCDFINADGSLSKKNLLISDVRCFVYLKGLCIFANNDVDPVFFSTVVQALNNAVSFLDAARGSDEWRSALMPFPFIDGFSSGMGCDEMPDFSCYIPSVKDEKESLLKSCEDYANFIQKTIEDSSSTDIVKDASVGIAIDIFNKLR